MTKFKPKQVIFINSQFLSRKSASECTSDNYMVLQLWNRMFTDSGALNLRVGKYLHSCTRLHSCSLLQNIFQQYALAKVCRKLSCLGAAWVEDHQNCFWMLDITYTYRNLIRVLLKTSYLTYP